ncbi:hypothetical protein Zm00014a_034848 [Zea mays]|nr:hypothetical protein Zm00014a_034848 [Zea mays]
MASFVKCMLGLDAIVWDIIGSSLLEKVVYLLTELDVNITWEDILQDEHNKGIFDMELEDLGEDEDNLGQEGTKVCHISRAILTTRNDWVDTINMRMIDRFQGEQMMYHSFDTTVDDPNNYYLITI